MVTVGQADKTVAWRARLFTPLFKTQFPQEGHTWPLALGELSHGLQPLLGWLYSSEKEHGGGC